MNKQAIEEWLEDNDYSSYIDGIFIELLGKFAKDLAPQWVSADIGDLLVEYSDKLVKEITQETEPEWVSIEDRMPENDQRVVIFLEGGAIASDLDVRIGMYSTQYGFGHSRVTHWQPLPTALDVVGS